MERNPVENNFVTRFILGFAVIFAMMIGGQVGGTLIEPLEIPYAGWVGVFLGAALVFAVFAVLYKRYDASFESE